MMIVIMLNVQNNPFMLSVIMLSVVMLIVVLLSVVAPVTLDPLLDGSTRHGYKLSCFTIFFPEWGANRGSFYSIFSRFTAELQRLPGCV